MATATLRRSGLKLLLDEHHDPEIAHLLRQLGHDVVAVAERADLRGRPDNEIFAVGFAEKRAIVTENARDFAVLARTATELHQRHSGVILTSASGHPRSANARNALVAALARLLEQHPSLDELQDVVRWL